MKKNNLTLTVKIHRNAPSKDSWKVKFVNSVRIILQYKKQNFSVVLYDIEDGGIDFNEEKICSLSFLGGMEIADEIKVGEPFTLIMANKPVAEGVVQEIKINGVSDVDILNDGIDE